MNDDFLTKFRKEPRPEFAAALYQRINKPVQIQSKLPALRLAALSLSVLAILATIVFLSPSALAFAGGIIRQVGGYVFTQGLPNPDPNRAPSPIQIVRGPDSVSLETIGYVPQAQDSGEASKMAGFAVLVPTYLPSGFSAMSGWFVTHRGNGTEVTNGYHSLADNFVVINQWKNDQGGPQQTYAREQIVDVTVRGQAGVWLPGAADGTLQKEALVWAEGDRTYSLISVTLPLDEMLKIAESLK